MYVARYSENIIRVVASAAEHAISDSCAEFCGCGTINLLLFRFNPPATMCAARVLREAMEPSPWFARMRTHSIRIAR
jgi:hypothetical protein